MIRRKYSFAWLSCMTLALAPLALGQEGGDGAAPPQQPANRELTNRELTDEFRLQHENLSKITRQLEDIVKLVRDSQENSRQIQEIGDRLNATDQRLDDGLENMANRIGAIDQAIAALQQDRQDLDRRITGNEQILSNLPADLGERLTQIQNSIEELKAAPNSTTTFRPWNDEETRKRLIDEVRSGLPREGLLHVTNTTDIDRTIGINRQDFVIPAGQARSFRVAAGTVTTQLPGEQMMTWTVAPPSYEQRIQIVPKSQRTTTARPIQPQQLAPPAIPAPAADSLPSLDPPVITSYFYPLYY